MGRCFLAGDAAHVHTPAGGQGMNTGIQDAYNLAWKLAFVIKRQADNALLATYNEERLANAIHLLHTTDQFFNVATGDQWWLRIFRDAILPGMVTVTSHIDRIKALMFPKLSMIDINYRERSLSQHTDDSEFAVKAGDRMPYFSVDGGNGYDRFGAPGFHLLLFSEDETRYDELRNTIETTYHGVMDVHSIPLRPKLIETFGVEKPFMVLLRPDNHISLITSNLLATTIQDYMSRVIGLKQPQLT